MRKIIVIALFALTIPASAFAFSAGGLEAARGTASATPTFHAIETTELKRDILEIFKRHSENAVEATPEVIPPDQQEPEEVGALETKSYVECEENSASNLTE